MTVTVVRESTPEVDTLKVAEVAPAGMTTDAGTVADELELLRFTVIPEGPALPLAERVPVEVPPATTVFGFKVSELNVAGVTVRVAF